MTINEPRRPAFFLAIRHKPSGGFLPQMTSYGFTRTEPTLDDPPRLFKKPGPARQALERWLQGEWWDGPESEDGTITARVIPKSNRRAVDMEIVEIELTSRSLSEARVRRL